MARHRSALIAAVLLMASCGTSVDGSGSAQTATTQASSITGTIPVAAETTDVGAGDAATPTTVADGEPGSVRDDIGGASSPKRLGAGRCSSESWSSWR